MVWSKMNMKMWNKYENESLELKISTHVCIINQLFHNYEPHNLS